MTPHPPEVLHFLIDGINNEERKETSVHILLEALLQTPPVRRLHLGFILIFSVTVEVVVECHGARGVSSLFHFFLLEQLGHMGLAGTREASEDNCKPRRSGESAWQLDQGVHPHLGPRGPWRWTWPATHWRTPSSPSPHIGGGRAVTRSVKTVAVPTDSGRSPWSGPRS